MLLREPLKEILCRQCDGISHADTCELDKNKCPVLKSAPDQILILFREAIDKVNLDRCLVDSITWQGKLAKRKMFRKEEILEIIISLMSESREAARETIKKLTEV